MLGEIIHGLICGTTKVSARQTAAPVCRWRAASSRENTGRRQEGLRVGVLVSCGVKRTGKGFYKSCTDGRVFTSIQLSLHHSYYVLAPMSPIFLCYLHAHVAKVVLTVYFVLGTNLQSEKWKDVDLPGYKDSSESETGKEKPQSQSWVSWFYFDFQIEQKRIFILIRWHDFKLDHPCFIIKGLLRTRFVLFAQIIHTNSPKKLCC